MRGEFATRLKLPDSKPQLVVLEIEPLPIHRNNLVALPFKGLFKEV